MWTSRKVNSDQSLNIEYGGLELKSSERLYWQVRVRDNKNKISTCSDIVFWEIGILDNSEWKAEWITMKGEEKNLSILAYLLVYAVKMQISSD